MSFRSELWTYVKTNFEPLLSYPIYYGQGEHGSGPFYTMVVVVDPEQGSTICEAQGDAGNALVQFTFSTGNDSDSASLGVAEDGLETLKILVAGLTGNIGNYDIWNNITSGVQTLDDPTLQWWGALFESSLSWNIVLT